MYAYHLGDSGTYGDKTWRDPWTGGQQSAGFTGLKWMDDGIDMKNLFH